MMTKYARRDMRSACGILRYYDSFCRRMMPKYVISEERYKKLSKKEKEKWTVLTSIAEKGYGSFRW